METIERFGERERLTEFVGVPISPTLKERLEARAAIERRSRADIVRLAIEQYLRSRQRPAPEEDVSTTPPADAGRSEKGETA